jgi:hypothetical protein
MKTSPSTPTTAQSAQAEPNAAKVPSCGYVYGYYFRPLRDYRDGELTRTEVMLLEYFLIMAEHYLWRGHASFWHSYKQISIDTDVAIDTVKKKVAKFKKLGFLSVRLTRPGGVPTATFFVRYLNIVKNTRLLFGKPNGKTKEQILRIKQRRIALVKMYLLRKKTQRASYND